ncbi:sugar phosphate isomerase/epimerase [soil metagenome]
MHPRVSVHQVAFLSESTTAFVEHCRTIGVEHLTLVTPLLMRPGGTEEARQAIGDRGPRVANVNHPFGTFPDLESDRGEATAKLLQAIDIAAQFGARNVYLLTGGRGSLTWEQAAERFAELVAPCKVGAAAAGVTLLIENASAFNADIHIAHTLADTLILADIAGIGVCFEIHACWMEAGLPALIKRAMPLTGLVQVSDYVLGDRTAPCRAVPGDGTIPLRRILGDVLDAGYDGVFDLELVGPRIEAEGARAATARGAWRLSDLLTTLGA